MSAALAYTEPTTRFLPTVSFGRQTATQALPCNRVLRIEPLFNIAHYGFEYPQTLGKDPAIIARIRNVNPFTFMPISSELGSIYTYK